jgi:hypothetical protein
MIEACRSDKNRAVAPFGADGGSTDDAALAEAQSALSGPILEATSRAIQRRSLIDMVDAKCVG